MSEKVSAKSAPKPCAAPPAAVLEGGVAETVVGGALVAVLEDVVGLVEFLELVLAVGVARIAVRVMLHGELAERHLEFGIAAGARDAQDLVIVALGHAGPAVRSKRFDRHTRFAPPARSGKRNPGDEAPG